MSRAKKSSWWDIPVTLAIAVGVVLLITTFVVKPFSIPSGSMENTLLVGDRVLVNRMVYHFRDVQRGDVIVFDGTDSFVPAGDKPQRNPISGAFTWIGQSLGLVQPDSTDFIKRVIGVAGDHVVCCDVEGRITINGAPLDETYLYTDDVPSYDEFDVVVGHCARQSQAAEVDARGNKNSSRLRVPHAVDLASILGAGVQQHLLCPLAAAPRRILPLATPPAAKKTAKSSVSRRA